MKEYIDLESRFDFNFFKGASRGDKFISIRPNGLIYFSQALASEFKEESNIVLVGVNKQDGEVKFIVDKTYDYRVKGVFNLKPYKTGMAIFSVAFKKIPVGRYKPYFDGRDCSWTITIPSFKGE